jgi:hypothetical protein|tara:strand:- start:215 stop:433 length:219 start_codon:yes stop_codon:yes gene_type:complete
MKISTNFIDYVLDFYGHGGIYDFGATKEMVVAATIERLETYLHTPFCADTVDRELVRDIMWHRQFEAKAVLV